MNNVNVTESSQLVKLRLEPQLTKDKKDGDSCSICTEDNKPLYGHKDPQEKIKGIVHLVCLDCIKAWKNEDCPECRAPLKVPRSLGERVQIISKKVFWGTLLTIGIIVAIALLPLTAAVGASIYLYQTWR